MKPQLKARIDRVCDGIIQNHLDLLLALLADRGVDVSSQRDRADTLVRALLSYELTPTLLDGGRRIPLDLDTSASPSGNGERMSNLCSIDISSAMVM